MRLFFFPALPEFRLWLSNVRGGFAWFWLPVLNGNHLNFDLTQESLFNELKIMRATTDHMNIIKLFEVFEGENTYYFIMELCEGNSLYDEIKNHQSAPFSDDVIHSITEDLLSGVAYCASKNIMHRDLKPENLLFGIKDSQKNLKLVDFGLAAKADEAPYIFPKCGTPGSLSNAFL